MVAVFAGAVVRVQPNRWDTVILDLPRGTHGIHLHAVIGMHVSRSALSESSASIPSVWDVPQESPASV